MKKMKNIAFIPARGGSKGILGKNLKEINGKPLIAWSIEHALLCDEVSKVYVSTDCDEIREVSLSYGAEVPFLRPKEISGDLASTESAVLHFLDWCQVEKILFENIILLQATSPFRYENTLSQAINWFYKSNADSLLTVTKTHKFIWSIPNSPVASYDIFNRPRRQDITIEDEVYFENGSFYITDINIYKKYKNRLGGNIEMFNLPLEESFEIDELIDFKIVELMMKEYGEIK